MTQEEFVNEVNRIFDNEYEVLGKYINKNEKVLLKHKMCRAEWSAAASNILQGKTDCPNRCKQKKKSLIKFKEKLLKLKGNDYTVIENYEGSEKPIIIKHELCGETFEICPHSLKNEKTLKCPYCNGRKIDTEIYKKRVKDLVGDEYEVIGEYTGTENNIHMVHKICGNNLYMKPHGFLGGNRCKYCQHRSYKKTTEEFKQELKERFGNEYEVLGEYTSAYDKIEVRHSICGEKYSTIPHTFLTNDGICPICNIENGIGGYKKTQEQFEKQIYKLTNDTYEVLGKYIDSYTKILMRHKGCGNTFKAVPHKFLTGQKRCSFCKGSKGEKEIASFLIKEKISYQQEYTFKDCRYKCVLPFDFAIFDKNNSLVFLVEFHGKQHFYPIKFFGGEKSFKERKRNDSIKEKYCETNKIPLIIIPYTEFNNINKILKEKTKDFKNQDCVLF